VCKSLINILQRRQQFSTWIIASSGGCGHEAQWRTREDDNNSSDTVQVGKSLYYRNDRHFSSGCLLRDFCAETTKGRRIFSLTAIENSIFIFPPEPF
jgi:hypothetical protein